MQSSVLLGMYAGLASSAEMHPPRLVIPRSRPVFSQKVPKSQLTKLILGIVCKAGFCWHCMAEYDPIRRYGNSNHRGSCELHTNNLPQLEDGEEDGHDARWL
jgi:hypothetical protein